MQSLNLKKPNWERHQQVFFDCAGYVLHSTGTIFSMKDISKDPITIHFPLIESIFETLLSLPFSKAELHLQGVESTFPYLSGFYDFTFEKVIFQTQEALLWTIYDLSNFYKNYATYLQRRNEAGIKKQSKIQ